MRPKLIAGLEIQPHPAGFDGYPTVAMFKVGVADSRSVLTTDEARRVGKTLIEAADAAEKP